ncbi:unnamed protein product [Phytomonas sp. Hart1]|nr:unnamed protein product [Phytomonas sp. Hart1]|eukprot:CCW67752.1 unnamed protein product [Phytomonas sp. isolate Hart1]
MHTDGTADECSSFSPDSKIRSSRFMLEKPLVSDQPITPLLKSSKEDRSVQAGSCDVQESPISSFPSDPRNIGTIDTSLPRDDSFLQDNTPKASIAADSPFTGSHAPCSSTPWLNSTPSIKIPTVSSMPRCDSLPGAEGRMQKFGCCVFFFPVPILSCLFPLVGHVAISNAEGTKLYTFESSYYVREECLIDVLDRVIEGISSAPEDFPHGRGVELVDLNVSPSSHSLPSRSAAMSVGGSSPVSSFRPIGGPRASASPGARWHNRSSRGVAAGHAHIACVRIWDLKPLLMERRHGHKSRIRAASLAGSRVAMVLFQRLQELLQTEGTNGKETSDFDVEPNSTLKDGHSSKDDSCYQLIDATTARFYNRNLQATISIFRDGPDGSNNSPDLLLKNRSSFSFVGFVLEVCGVGDPLMSSGENKSLSSSHGALSSTDVTPLVVECDSSISWGTVRLVTSISLFGKLYRNERRAWRMMQGGTLVGAVMIWVILIAVLYYFLFPLLPRFSNTIWPL